MAHWPWTELISDWFGETLDSPLAIAAHREFWFAADPDRDTALAEKYGRLVDQCASGHLYRWLDQPEGRLALVIALDQLPRNLFRGTPRAFAYDAQTAAWCLAAVHTGQDQMLKKPACSCSSVWPGRTASGRSLPTSSLPSRKFIVTSSPGSGVFPTAITSLAEKALPTKPATWPAARPRSDSRFGDFFPSLSILTAKRCLVGLIERACESVPKTAQAT